MILASLKYRRIRDGNIAFQSYLSRHYAILSQKINLCNVIFQRKKET